MDQISNLDVNLYHLFNHILKWSDFLDLGDNQYIVMIENNPTELEKAAIAFDLRICKMFRENFVLCKDQKELNALQLVCDNLSVYSMEEIEYLVSEYEEEMEDYR